MHSTDTEIERHYRVFNAQTMPTHDHSVCCHHDEYQQQYMQLHLVEKCMYICDPLSKIPSYDKQQHVQIGSQIVK